MTLIKPRGFDPTLEWNRGRRFNQTTLNLLVDRVAQFKQFGVAQFADTLQDPFHGTSPPSFPLSKWPSLIAPSRELLMPALSMIEAPDRSARKTGLPLVALRSLTMQASNR
jgi:uncharacterized membrane protein